ncbi:hypothetical protein [Aeoliella sp.]|uniref:hypothetical protein n=1 Tax=Aeoliella sp. TaxID=2795800 RepID=UPI003CCB9A91
MDEQEPDTIAPSAKPLMPAVLQRVAAMKSSGAEVLLLDHFPKSQVVKLLAGGAAEKAEARRVQQEQERRRIERWRREREASPPSTA